MLPCCAQRSMVRAGLQEHMEICPLSHGFSVRVICMWQETG